MTAKEAIEILESTALSIKPKIIEYGSGSGNYIDRFTDAYTLAIEALKRSEKKMPNVLDAYEKSYDLECPNCGAGNFHLMYDDNVADHFDFCAHCGQALDWRWVTV